MGFRQVICFFVLASLTISTGQTLGCKQGQWQCDDGNCIPDIWRCDGAGDCLDGSDEMDCSGSSECPPGQFPCMDSVGCVDASARCDGQIQCPTGSDEENCTATEGCLESDWTCQNRMCIPKELRCNGLNDCLDNSDEDDCGPCGEDGLRCPEGTCLSAHQRCDGQIDCSDGSDEPITCGRICSINNGGCSHVCVDEDWGSLCACPDGYKLSANGAVCEDLDECATPLAPCMHHCTNTVGSYYCHCRDGFKLVGNSCQATGDAVKLLMVQRKSIGLLNVKSQQFEAIQTPVSDPVAVSFDVSRGRYYWADNQGNIYRSDGQLSSTIYTGEPGIKGLACDWLNGNLFWTNQKTESIYMQAADEESYTTVLSKNISPSELVLIPVESLMFWINAGHGDRVTIEKSWMDGSDRGSLTVLTAQSAHSLTADVAARRLYWISDYKKSIETVKLDGTGHYSFTGLFNRRLALGLAVFESSFYWVDDKGLWQVPQKQPEQRTFIWKVAQPLLAVYHELQQPQGSSACAKSPCHLCQLTKGNPVGFTCTCPNSKVLLLEGACEYPKFIYATITNINVVEFRESEATKTQLFATDDGILSFDLDWYKDWLYWANQTGHIQRTSLTQVKTEVMPTPLPVCLIKVDQRSGNLYWVSCDQNSIGTTTADNRYSRQLYHTTGEIRDLYLDWLRGGILWLEEKQILSMSMMGGEAKELLHLTGEVRGNIAFDLRAGSLLWNSKRAGLTTMSFLQERSHRAGRRWNISGSVIAAFEPFLLSISEDVAILWDRRDGTAVRHVSVIGQVLSVVTALRNVHAVPDTPVCVEPSMLCRRTSICLSQAQLCDGKKDCPDGDDEDFCVNTCPSKEDFKCKDRRSCISRNQVCDGRSHCRDGSDEVDCPAVASPAARANILKCRTGSKPCKDGTECVLYSHVCDGEKDCRDGSDEEGCDATDQTSTPTKSNIDPSNKEPPAPKPPAPTVPACSSPSVLCPRTSAHICISPSQFCDGRKDCPDGFDEQNCVRRCPLKTDFRCKDRRSCVSRSLVCDGRSQCHDGSDEVGCPSPAPPAARANLKCRMGSRLCQDGTECVLFSHVCDGERDCRDGSDEVGCDAAEVAPTTTTQKLNTSPEPVRPFTETPTEPSCTSPSILCPGSSLCINPTQFCDGRKDCPDASDEKCVKKCLYKTDFLCKDRRRCVSKSQICDGRSHCHDGSDEVGCPSPTPPAARGNLLKCRLGSRLCRDGTECVLLSHVCDGERDCRDGSDEEGCDAADAASTILAEDSHLNESPAPMEPFTKPPTEPPTEPSCTSPSTLCPGSSLCINPTQFCDGKKDCPDGSDENCVKRCPYKTDFRCKDRRSCVSKSLVCDGRSHCHDGSDEVNCPSVARPAAQTNVLKCRMGSRLCRDGTECVLFSHVCDGERDCRDGSDEEECDAADTATTILAVDPHLKESPAPIKLSTEPPAEPSCSSPSVLCPGSSLCINPTQFCDGKKDCPDGSDENCVKRCPNKSDFRCKDRRSCVSKNLVCDGRSHCHDGSDEVNCPSPTPLVARTNVLKCRLGSRLCRDGTECVLFSHVCDGERDCRDGSDEEGCDAAETVPATVTENLNKSPLPVKPFTEPATQPSCTSPSTLCPGSSLCINPTQFCDGKKDCPDGSDENCVKRCPYKTDFLCKDRRSCISKIQVCDGRSNCHDGSDEVSCPGLTPPAAQSNALKCRMGSKPCNDGKECVLYSHVCDGEKDCLDGSDEQGCPDTCKQGEFQCFHGNMCIPEAQVCDGRSQCRDQSDELVCSEQTKSCEHRCGDGNRCIPNKFLCDGERDCLDGSDEQGCDPVVVAATTESPVLTSVYSCITPSVLCPGSSQCISQNQLCDGQTDCPDGFDENNCVFQCKNTDDFLCSDRRACIPRTKVCDGRAHCSDSSDEKQCQSTDPSAPFSISGLSTRSVPLRCRTGFKPCKDGLECVMYSHVCDGERDCKDGSDEEGCATRCKAGEFQCAHGHKCIPPGLVCDGQYDCQDRSDEMDCSTLTEGCHHRCDNNTRCIPETFLCDGERDCADGSDEAKCGLVACSINQYRCASGQCVSEALRCDGYADCSDHSDEVDCTRPPRCPAQLRCPHSHECLQKEWLCDGEDDCKDGSDERDCMTPPAKCREYQWQCGDGSQCIPLSWRCDGKRDCHNGMDEDKCSQRGCPSHLYQCGSGECLDPRLVCNGFTNCADSSDEGAGCAQRNCSSQSAPQCDHQCVSTPNGPACYCAAGFRLDSSAVSCVDIDECNALPHAVCKHTCLNIRGSYTCHCHPGFYLEPDNKSCKTKDEPSLLASVQSELLLLGVHSGTLRLLSSASRPVFSLDYHWAQQRVYWLSPDYQSIRWADMKRSNNKGTLVKGVKSDFIAVDWVGQNLYWVDGLVGQILAVKLSDDTVRSQDYTVVLGEDLEQPSSLVLLPHRGLMLWSEIGSSPQIERSGMDGSKRKVVVSENLSWPVSLAYDLLDNRVYWADEKLRCIGSASLDGDNIKILQLAETPSPFSVAVFNDRVFWSDTKRRTIRSADKNMGKDQKVLLKRPGQPFGLKLMHALSQPTISSPCNKLQCSHLCLLAPAVRVRSGPPGSPGDPAVRGPTAVCRCPKGMLLSKDKITCSLPTESSFILLLSRTTVYQIYLHSMHRDGVALKKMPNNRELSLPGVTEASVLDVAIQELSMYVADAVQGSVDVLKLSGPRSRQGLTPSGQILKLKDDSVTALAVDWVTSNLYWSSTERPDLHVTTRRDKYTTSLLQGSLKGTTSIALHPPSGRLCYTALTAAGGKSQTEVNCAWMDGRNKVVLWRKSSIPTSLVFSNQGTVIYWADTGEGVINSIGVDGSRYKQYKTGPGLLISFTHTENILLWVTLDKDVSKLWFSDGLQPNQLWFETKTSLVEVRAYSTDSQSGTNICSNNNGGCAHLCLAYPQGRTCKCGQGFSFVNATSCIPLPDCPPGQESCFDGSKCISSSKFCDGQVDCPDQSDEEDCPTTNSASFGTKTSDGRPPKSSSSSRSNTEQNSISPVRKDSPSCDFQRCHGHGSCIKQGKVTRCHCEAGYTGEFCQETETGQSHVGMVLGVLCLIVFLMGAAFIFVKRRAWASIRSRSIEKENLMANMGLPGEIYDSDSEELESPVDVKNPPISLKSLQLRSSSVS